MVSGDSAGRLVTSSSSIRPPYWISSKTSKSFHGSQISSDLHQIWHRPPSDHASSTPRFLERLATAFARDRPSKSAAKPPNGSRPRISADPRSFGSKPAATAQCRASGATASVYAAYPGLPNCLLGHDNAACSFNYYYYNSAMGVYGSP